MQDNIRLAIIYGSTREGRFCDIVVNWAASMIRRRADFECDIVDPLEFDLPARHTGTDHAGLDRLKARLAGADAFVVVTPEYNHSFPAALKFLIDSVAAEWQAKPVAFIS
ncbi:NADPH-dependent FMN reductase [Mesorhizobium xinjiangense]|uniref:NADPH-dependent FMN reductase n=1 Tax=Mesorhizobium xinjiangense TaxID=2678685 RepID=UPI0012ED5AE0|nr:NAD(P)H-dependent oxidoreductase [Mesorhizobium xinjiangense]